MVLHAIKSISKTAVVHARDMDVLLLLVSHFPRLQCTSLGMMLGISKKRNCIPIGVVYNNLPSNSTSSLLPLHALTGCDTTSYLSNHSKWPVWKIFKEYFPILHGLGEGEMTDAKRKSAVTFIYINCRIYN